MIAKLTGKIDVIGSDYIILDVGGVGYMVHASSRTLALLGDAGSNASLLIDMQVREDSMTLFGFANAEEQEWFRLLTSVQGVGAKVGIAILSACPADQLVMAIMADDKNIIRQAEGVGPKLAVRIITELKDKVAKMDMGSSNASAMPSSSVAAPVDTASVNIGAEGNDNKLNQDALSALINLGYGRADAYKAVLSARAQFDGEPELGHLITAGLKELAS